MTSLARKIGNTLGLSASDEKRARDKLHQERTLGAKAFKQKRKKERIAKASRQQNR